MRHDLEAGFAPDNIITTTPFRPKTQAPATRTITASPFVWRDPTSIPPRKWQYRKHFVKGYVTETTSAGGGNKTGLTIVDMLAMITGRPLLGHLPHSKLSVWYLNLEDPLEEIERRIAAACLHYNVDPHDLQGRLFINSGRDTPLVIATDSKDGAVIVEPVVTSLCNEIEANGVDVLIVDPFVASHGIPENDNTKINGVVKAWARVAHSTSTSVDLVHHVRKGSSGQAEVNADDGRGASALKDGARSVRVLNAMTAEEAEKARVENRSQYFRMDNGKANMAPRSDKSEWFKVISIPLDNAADG